MAAYIYTAAQLKREANFVDCHCPENPPHRIKLQDYGIGLGVEHPYLWVVQVCTKHNYQQTTNVAI